MKSNISKNKSFSLIIFIITFSTALAIVFLGYKDLELGKRPGNFVQAQSPPCDPSDPCCEDNVIDPCYCRKWLVCEGIEPIGLAPVKGETVTFTCRGNKRGVEIYDYKFRVNIDGQEGSPVSVVATGDKTSATYDYIIPDTGDEFIAQCKVCTTGGYCTEWGSSAIIRVPG